MKKSAELWMAVAVVAMSACAGVQKVPTRLAAVRSVAVIGFGGEVNITPKETKSGIGLLDQAVAVKSSVDMVKGLTDGSLQEGARQEANNAYDKLAERLQKDLGWQVASRADVSANAAYSKMYHDLTAGDSSNRMAEDWATGLRAQKILYVHTARPISETQRKELMTALGVDALIFAEVLVHGKSSGFSVGGVGTSSVRPQAVIKIEAFDGQSADPIWRDSWAEGEPTEESISSNFGIQAGADRTPLVLTAIDRGIDAMLARYQGK